MLYLDILVVYIDTFYYKNRTCLRCKINNYLALVLPGEAEIESPLFSESPLANL